MTIPSEVQRYLEQLAARLSSVLDDQLIGVYVLGGGAFDDYRHGTSDLDVYAVVRSPLERYQKGVSRVLRNDLDGGGRHWRRVGMDPNPVVVDRGYYATTNPGARVREAIAPHRVAPGRWQEALFGPE